MFRLFRYLLLRFAAHTSVVGTGLLLLSLMLVAARYQALLSEPWQPAYLHVVVSCLPAAASLVLPASLFLATLITLDRLRATHALLGLMSLGYSRTQLLLPLLTAALLLLPVTLFVHHQWEPISRAEARRQLLMLEGQTLSQRAREHLPLTLGGGVFATPLSIQDFQGYLLEDNRDPAHPMRYMAQHLNLTWHPDTLLITLALTNGEAYSTQGTQTLDHLRFEALTLDLSLDASLFKRDLFELNSTELSQRVRDTEQQHKSARFERLTLARRTALPATLPAWILLGFGLSFRRKQDWARRLNAHAASAPGWRWWDVLQSPWLMGTVGLMAFYFLSRGADGLSARLDQRSPLPAIATPEVMAWLPTVLLSLVGLLLTLRALLPTRRPTSSDHPHPPRAQAPDGQEPSP